MNSLRIVLFSGDSSHVVRAFYDDDSAAAG
jgi:hypothetical protein